MAKEISHETPVRGKPDFACYDSVLDEWENQT